MILTVTHEDILQLDQLAFIARNRGYGVAYAGVSIYHARTSFTINLAVRSGRKHRLDFMGDYATVRDGLLALEDHSGKADGQEGGHE
jgi:hypothetical protein